MTRKVLVFTLRSSCFRAARERGFDGRLSAVGICHRRLRPHAPESNGKVARFIKNIDAERLAVHSRRRAARVDP